MGAQPFSEHQLGGGAHNFNQQQEEDEGGRKFNTIGTSLRYLSEVSLLTPLNVAPKKIGNYLEMF